MDENMDYITAAYFSNSGGQTNNVEDVWLKALPYLKVSMTHIQYMDIIMNGRRPLVRKVG